MSRLFFFPFVAAATFSSHIFAAPPTSEEVEAYWQKIASHQQDALDIGKNLIGLDMEIQIGLTNLANPYFDKLTYIQDLLLIDSLVQNEPDRQRIKLVISRRIKAIANGIDLTIKFANENMAHAKSPAVVATASRLRDDLRELKELLLKF